MNQSIVEQRSAVVFPEFTGERVYMRAFRKSEGLPRDLQRWQRTVDQMLDGVDAEGPIYLMVDQAPVKAGDTHRRGGVHIDGHWLPAIQAHGAPPYPGHGMPSRQPSTPPGRHGHIHRASGTEALILASSVEGCRAYAGEWMGDAGEGGDCSHLDLRALVTVPMLAGRAYAGNVTMLHESIPMRADCLRTVVRLNVPGWSPE